MALLAVRETPSRCPVMRGVGSAGLLVVGAVWGAAIGVLCWHLLLAAGWTGVLIASIGMSALILLRAQNAIPAAGRV
jgi:CHASE2 domain-containing sensor protein